MGINIHSCIKVLHQSCNCTPVPRLTILVNTSFNTLEIISRHHYSRILMSCTDDSWTKFGLSEIVELSVLQPITTGSALGMPLDWCVERRTCLSGCRLSLWWYSMHYWRAVIKCFGKYLYYSATMASRFTRFGVNMLYGVTSNVWCTFVMKRCIIYFGDVNPFSIQILKLRSS